MANSESERFSPLALARTLGILGLLGIVTGAFQIGYVQNALIVPGNPAVTLHNLLAHQALFRAGFSAHLFELLINIPAEILTFILLRRVNSILAALALSCGFLGIAIEAVDLLYAYLPLKLALESSALGAFTADQLHAVANLSAQLDQAALLLSWVFYGVDEIFTGYLLFRSRFFPRVIGILLLLSGLGYFTHGFLYFLAPAIDARIYPYVIYPCLPGEGLTNLWLAIFGINVAAWHAWAAKPPSEISLS